MDVTPDGLGMAVGFSHAPYMSYHTRSSTSSVTWVKQADLSAPSSEWVGAIAIMPDGLEIVVEYYCAATFQIMCKLRRKSRISSKNFYSGAGITASSFVLCFIKLKSSVQAESYHIGRRSAKNTDSWS